MDSKKPWMSKTLWLAAITALAPFCPPVAAFMVANPAAVSAGLGAAFAALRLISNGKIAMGD